MERLSAGISSAKDVFRSGEYDRHLLVVLTVCFGLGAIQATYNYTTPEAALAYYGAGELLTAQDIENFGRVGLILTSLGMGLIVGMYYYRSFTLKFYFVLMSIGIAGFWVVWIIPHLAIIVIGVAGVLSHIHLTSFLVPEAEEIG